MCLSPSMHRLQNIGVLGILLSGAIFVILYGSLFPFRFSVPREAFELSLNGTAPVRAADAIGNIILFLPASFLAVLYARQKDQRITLWVCGLLFFSIALQLAQIYVRFRVPSVTDVLFNAIGIAAGSLAATVFDRPRLRSYFVEHQIPVFPFLLLIAFAINQLMPLLPSLSVRNLLYNWRAMQGASAIVDFQDILTHAAYWFAATALISKMTKPAHLVSMALLAITSLFLFRFPMISNVPSLWQLMGGMLGIACFQIRAFSEKQKTAMAAMGLCIVVAYNGLTPFQFRNAPGSMALIPFWGYLTGNMVINFMALTQKLFLYGASLFLLANAGFTKIKVVGGIALFLFMIELSQIYLRSGTPEVSDPILALLLGLLTYRFVRGPAKTRSPEFTGNRT